MTGILMELQNAKLIVQGMYLDGIVLEEVYQLHLLVKLNVEMVLRQDLKFVMTEFQ